jgi:phosphate transport system protein
MTKHLLRDLEQLADDLLHMTTATETAFARALESILTRDYDLARKVVDGDVDIDRMEVRLEEDALKVLALHVPVAGDLRFVVSAIKMNHDLERIADIAANIAKRALEMSAMPPVTPPEGFDEMAQHARTMLREAILALVRRDPQLAVRVCAADDEVDQLQRQILPQLEARMQREPQHIPALLRWVNAVRNIERIADGATNLAEDVIYLEEGEIIRHRGIKKPPSESAGAAR